MLVLLNSIMNFGLSGYYCCWVLTLLFLTVEIEQHQKPWKKQKQRWKMEVCYLGYCLKVTVISEVCFKDFGKIPSGITTWAQTFFEEISERSRCLGNKETSNSDAYNYKISKSLPFIYSRTMRFYLQLTYFVFVIDVIKWPWIKGLNTSSKISNSCLLSSCAKSLLIHQMIPYILFLWARTSPLFLLFHPSAVLPLPLKHSA